MPFRCVVPRCRGNYDEATKVHVFGFPKDPAMQKKWTSAIHREDFVPSKSSKECHHQFHENDIFWEKVVYNQQGEKLSAKLSIPKLRSDTVPSVFPNCPAHLSKQTSRREGPSEKRGRLEMEQIATSVSASIASQEEYNSKFCFKNLQELENCIDHINYPSVWTVVKPNAECLCFVKFAMKPSPVVISSVAIDIHQSVHFYSNNISIHKVGSHTFPIKCNDVHVLEKNLIDCAEYSFGSSENSLSDCINAARRSVLEVEEKDWLDLWEESKPNTGYFSRETAMALKQTTYAVIEIARYCINEFDMEYLMSARLQTDGLEERFGQYRQLSGSQYHISIT